MGCAYSRDKTPEEERTLITFERTLQLYRKSATSVDLTFRKYSYKDEVNLSQLSEACAQIGIQRRSTEASPNVEVFFTELCNESGKYPLKRLLLLGVLLCSGTPQEKARLLFEIYDDCDRGVLDGPAVKQMAEDLFELSVNLLPILVPSQRRGDHDPIKVKYYRDKILYRSAKSKEMLRLVLIGGSASVGRDTFTACLSCDDRRRLLSASGIRDFCYKYWQAAPSSWHMAEAVKASKTLQA